jgi:hypothetical protein
MNYFFNRLKEDFDIIKISILAFLRKKQFLRDSFTRHLTENKKTVYVYFALTAFYSTLVIYFMNSPIFFDSVRTAKSLVSAFFLYPVFYLLLKLLCVKTNGIFFPVRKEKQPLQIKTVFSVSAFCFIPFFLLFLINFPGGITTDNEVQWQQIQNFTFTDWHPVIHTFGMWLLTRIINHYGFIIFCQVLIFSFSLGVLTATMEAWGFSRKILLCMVLFFVLNPMVKNILMFAYKDTVFTILLVFTITSLINIYFSEGKWLGSFKNILKLSLCFAFLSMVRKNGVLFTFPLLFLLLLFYAGKKPKSFLIVPISLFIFFIIRFPLYSALEVNYPNNTYTETVGVPMTIMCDIFVKNPQALPDDAMIFLTDFDRESGWSENYELGNFSSVKGKFDKNRIIATVPKIQFFRMLAETILSDPYNSFQAFRNHSAFVWELFAAENVFISAPWKRDLERETNAVKKTAMFLSVFYDNTITAILPLGWLFAKNGWHILIIILAGLIALYRGGTKALLLVLPFVFYTFATMMLLSASDLRYFQFNAVVFLPLCFVLLSKKTTVA